MIPVAAHAARRARLATMVSRPIVLMGNNTRARNLPMNDLPFRQDSTFLYYTGCPIPGAATLIRDGRCTLYLEPPAPDDALWHGHVDDLATLGARYAVDEVRPLAQLEADVRAADPAVLAVADENRNRTMTAWTGTPLVFGHQHGDADLVSAVILQRRTKSEDELTELRLAGRHTAAAHRLLMQATKPGGSERALAALFEAYLATRGCALGYATILSQDGEILHNHSHDNTLEAGRLLLLDGGAEVSSGYTADVTRTWPVSGSFSPRQRAAYEAVLAAQDASIALCRPGVRYKEVHDASSLVLARFLLDEGLLKNISPEDAVERGAHALFFPHGVGHLLGLDVHDLENFGDLPSYPPGRARPAQFGTRDLRLDLPLEPGWVVTIEPGFYVVPAILADSAITDPLADCIDLSAAERWKGFGGIRIEDDVAITPGAPAILTSDAPRTVAEVEAAVGAGAPLEVLLR